MTTQLSANEVIAKILREAREACGLSQEEVGSRWSPPRARTTITNIERGRTPITIPMLEQWARICGMDWQDFLMRISPVPAFALCVDADGCGHYYGEHWVSTNGQDTGCGGNLHTCKCLGFTVRLRGGRMLYEVVEMPADSQPDVYTYWRGVFMTHVAVGVRTLCGIETVTLEAITPRREVTCPACKERSSWNS